MTYCDYRGKLEEDHTLRDRTPLAPEDIIRLLSLCLKCTHVLFQGEYDLHTQGSHGSPVLQPVNGVLRTVSSSHGTTPTKAGDSTWMAHAHHEEGPCTRFHGVVV